MHHAIVIIGSGLAGVTLAREIRRIDPEIDVAIVTASAGEHYAKPALSNALAAGRGVEQLRLADAARLAADLRIAIHPRVTVRSLDLEARRLDTSDGAIGFDQLVLAVGARQRRPDLAGNGADQVMSINDLDDYAAMRRRLAAASRVAIVGAGLIGCEFANDLRLGGFGVELYDVAPAPLARLLPAMASQRMRRGLEDIGVGMHLGSAILGIERGTAHTLELVAEGGAGGRYDLVLSATGLQPELRLAREAGLLTGAGIRTDAALATSHPGVFALGDCAEVHGRLLPYVMPILQGARALARTLTGTTTPVDYPPVQIVVKTPACPTVIFPPARERGDWSVLHDAPDSLQLEHREAPDGRLTGVVLQGDAVRDRSRLAARLAEFASCRAAA